MCAARNLIGALQLALEPLLPKDQYHIDVHDFNGVQKQLKAQVLYPTHGVDHHARSCSLQAGMLHELHAMTSAKKPHCMSSMHLDLQGEHELLDKKPNLECTDSCIQWSSRPTWLQWQTAVAREDLQFLTAAGAAGIHGLLQG